MEFNLSDETVETVRNGLATALAHHRINLKRAARAAKKCVPNSAEHTRALSRVDGWRVEVEDTEAALSIFEDTK